MESETPKPEPTTPPHPRMLGWVGTAALAMGGSNQMIFLITALFVGQGAILRQGSAGARPTRLGPNKSVEECRLSASCAEELTLRPAPRTIQPRGRFTPFRIKGE